MMGRTTHLLQPRIFDVLMRKKQPGQDLNLERGNQNPLCCQLHHRVIHCIEQGKTHILAERSDFSRAGVEILLKFFQMRKYLPCIH